MAYLQARIAELEKERKTVGFYHGALADSYEKQANEQGYTLGEYAKEFERIGEAVLVLIFEDMLTDKQFEGILQKLQKKIVKKLKPLESEE